MGDFFGTGIIVADFRQGGMTAWARERLKILVKVGASWLAHALSTLPGTPSGPAAFLGFTARNTRLTLCSCTVNGMVQEPGVGGDKAGAGECCWDDPNRAKKLFSSSASDALISAVDALQPLKFVMLCMPRHTSRALLLDRWDSMRSLWSALALVIPLFRSARAALYKALSP